MGRIVVPRPRMGTQRFYRPGVKLDPSMSKKFGAQELELLFKAVDAAVGIGGKIAGSVQKAQQGARDKRAAVTSAARKEGGMGAADAMAAVQLAKESPAPSFAVDAFEAEQKAAPPAAPAAPAERVPDRTSPVIATAGVPSPEDIAAGRAWLGREFDPEGWHVAPSAADRAVWAREVSEEGLVQARAGLQALRAGDTATAIQRFDAAEGLLIDSLEESRHPKTLRNLAELARLQGEADPANNPDAKTQYRTLLSLAEHADQGRADRGVATAPALPAPEDLAEEGRALASAGFVALQAGDTATALSRFDQAEALLIDSLGESRTPEALQNLADIARLQGEADPAGHPDAEARYQRLLSLAVRAANAEPARRAATATAMPAPGPTTAPPPVAPTVTVPSPMPTPAPPSPMPAPAPAAAPPAQPASTTSISSLEAQLHAERERDKAREVRRKQLFTPQVLGRMSPGELRAVLAFAKTPEEAAQVMRAVGESPDVQPTSLSDLWTDGHIQRAEERVSKGWRPPRQKAVDYQKRMADLMRSEAYIKRQEGLTAATAADAKRRAEKHAAELKKAEAKAARGTRRYAKGDPVGHAIMRNLIAHRAHYQAYTEGTGQWSAGAIYNKMISRGTEPPGGFTTDDIARERASMASRLFGDLADQDPQGAETLAQTLLATTGRQTRARKALIKTASGTADDIAAANKNAAIADRATRRGDIAEEKLGHAERRVVLAEGRAARSLTRAEFDLIKSQADALAGTDDEEYSRNVASMIEAKLMAKGATAAAAGAEIEPDPTDDAFLNAMREKHGSAR